MPNGGDVGRGAQFTERGKKLFQESHPDRYIVAYLPGGSLYMRNAPLPFAWPRRPRPGGRDERSATPT